MKTQTNKIYGRKEVRGDELPELEQRKALAKFVHRFTKEHVPEWSRKPMPNGKPTPVQFASDADWLANTFFKVNANGTIYSRTHCQSAPTWPDNPELR